MRRLLVLQGTVGVNSSSTAVLLAANWGGYCSAELSSACTPYFSSALGLNSFGMVYGQLLQVGWLCPALLLSLTNAWHLLAVEQRY